MVNWSKYIWLTLALSLMVVACREEDEVEDTPVALGVGGLGWENGRAASRSAIDAVPTTNLPTPLTVVPSTGSVFTIRKSGDDDTEGFVAYHTSSKTGIHSLREWHAEGKTYTACTPYPYNLRASYCGLTDYISSDPTVCDIEQNHLYFHLYHRCALVRFYFSLGEKYGNIRVVKITSLKMAGVSFPTDDYPIEVNYNDSYPTLAAYFYVAPRSVGVTSPLQVEVSYKVYSRNEHIGALQLTREVNDQNLSLPVLTSTTDPSLLLSTLDAGKYYDLQLRIDPDYLYTLSNNDDPVDLIIH